MENSSIQLLQQMKLSGMVQAYQASLQLPINQQPEAHQLVALMVDAEQQHRMQKRMNMFLRLSKLRYDVGVQNIDCSTERNLSKETFQKLCNCTYIDSAQNVLITGATGCGKSYLACALGHQACVMGYRTLYFNMNRLSEQLLIAKTDGTIIKWLDKIRKAKLIIFDDFGLKPLSHDTKLTLLQILEDRYAKGSTIFVSQLPVDKWHQYIDEPTIADAILDRLISQAHRIELKGKSLRSPINF